MPQYTFGTGTLIAKRTDVSGTQVAFFGVTERWDLDFDQKLVPLVGSQKVAVDVAPATLTVTGEIKFTQIMATTFGNLLFGNQPTAGAGFDLIGPENYGNLTGPNVTIANSATFITDLGVFYHRTGQALIPVTSAPSAGQYIPAEDKSAGIYTFATADFAVPGGLDIWYQSGLTSQNEIDVDNVPMGTGPVLQLIGSVPFAVAGVPKKLNLEFYCAHIGRSPLAFDNKKYLLQSMAFLASADGQGRVCRWSSTE